MKEASKQDCDNKNATSNCGTKERPTTAEGSCGEKKSSCSTSEKKECPTSSHAKK